MIDKFATWDKSDFFLHGKQHRQRKRQTGKPFRIYVKENEYFDLSFTIYRVCPNL